MKANAELTNLLKLCIDKEISDLHISVNTNPIGRIHGQLQSLCDHVYSEKELLELSQETLSQSEFSELKNERSIDAAISLDSTRFRINIYHERGYLAWAVRRLESKLKSVEELYLPHQLLDMARLKDGLILFTGPTGSGKSTSLATLLNYINENRSCHILTIEDPIEYLHFNNHS